VIGWQMATSISVLLALLAGLLSIPVVVFFIEVIASLIPGKDEPTASSDISKSVAVVVPAHNESSGNSSDPSGYQVPISRR